MIKQAFLISTLSFGFSGFAQAEFIQGDWLVDGDAQTTLDTRTGQEWLKLGQTVGMTLAEVNLALSNELSGWKIAGIDDILNLGYSQMEIAGNLNKFWDSRYIDSMHSPTGDTNFGYTKHPSILDAIDFSAAFGGEATADYSEIASNGTYGMYANEYKGKVGMFASQHTNTSNSGLFVSTITSDRYHIDGIPNVGWWLVSDGGASLNSINNPNINIQSSDFIDASITSTSVSDVSGPLSLGAFAFLAIGFAGLRRKQK